MNTSCSCPLLSKTPCALGYIEPCKCSHFQFYIYLNSEDPDRDTIGSLDPIVPRGFSITKEYLDHGEVKVFSDGLLHPNVLQQPSRTAADRRLQYLKRRWSICSLQEEDL